MPRQVQILIPDSAVESLKLGTTVSEMIKFLSGSKDVHSLAQFKGEDCKLIIFRSTEKKLGGIIETLSTYGVGVDFGVIDIIPLQSTKPRLINFKLTKGREYRLTDRMPMEEIHEAIDSQIHLTFDFILFLIIASVIAGAGIATDSAVAVVASMIVSPLMGPILGLTFGTITRDKTMVWKAFINELIGVFIAFFIGLIFGIILSFTTISWPKNEMLNRGTLASLWSSTAIAIPSGAGVALAITGGGWNALVGIAMSASLLPPVVCSGMNLVYGTMALIMNKDNGTGPRSRIHAKEWLLIAMYSFLLFVLNLVLIYLTGLLVFWVKKLKPILKPKGKWHSLPSVVDGVKKNQQQTSLLQDDDLLFKTMHTNIQ